MTVVGIDITEIDRISSALSRWGERFKEKVFLPSEIEFCESRAFPEQHFAARFAAKEAVATTLKSSKDIFLHWRDVEIVSENNGAPKVILHGEAARQFDQSKISLSISHSGDSAVAVALLNS